MGALWALSRLGGGMSSIKATQVPRLRESPCPLRGRQQGGENQGASGSHQNPKRKPRGSKEQGHVLFLATNNGKLLPEWCKFCLITVRPFPGGRGREEFLQLSLRWRGRTQKKAKPGGQGKGVSANQQSPQHRWPAAVEPPAVSRYASTG